MILDKFKSKPLYFSIVFNILSHVLGAKSNESKTKILYYERKSSSSSSDSSLHEQASCSKSKSGLCHEFSKRCVPHHESQWVPHSSKHKHPEKGINVPDRMQNHFNVSCECVKTAISGSSIKFDTKKRLDNLKERVKLENIRRKNCKTRIANLRNPKRKLKCIEDLEKINDRIIAMKDSCRKEGLDISDFFNLELEAQYIESSIYALENYLTNHNV